MKTNLRIFQDRQAHLTVRFVANTASTAINNTVQTVSSWFGGLFGGGKK